MRRLAGRRGSPLGKQLQSVLSGGRKLAVIDGTVVPLGGMFGEARVIKITKQKSYCRRAKRRKP